MRVDAGRNEAAAELLDRLEHGANVNRMRLRKQRVKRRVLGGESRELIDARRLLLLRVRGGGGVRVRRQIASCLVEIRLELALASGERRADRRNRVQFLRARSVD